MHIQNHLSDCLQAYTKHVLQTFFTIMMSTALCLYNWEQNFMHNIWTEVLKSIKNLTEDLSVRERNSCGCRESLMKVTSCCNKRKIVGHGCLLCEVTLECCTDYKSTVYIEYRCPQHLKTLMFHFLVMYAEFQGFFLRLWRTMHIKNTRIRQLAGFGAVPPIVETKQSC